MHITRSLGYFSKVIATLDLLSMDNINNWEYCGFPLMFCLNTLITAGIIPISSCQFNEVAQEVCTTCWWWWLSWRGLLIWTVTLDVTVFFHYLMNILNFSSFIDNTWFPPHCYLARYRKISHRIQIEGIINTNCYYMEINIFIICKGMHIYQKVDLSFLMFVFSRIINFTSQFYIKFYWQMKMFFS